MRSHLYILKDNRKVTFLNTSKCIIFGGQLDRVRKKTQQKITNNKNNNRASAEEPDEPEEPEVEPEELAGVTRKPGG